MTDFYRSKKVVCTGGAGMIGSHLVELLLSAGATVTVLDNFSRGHIRIDHSDAYYVYGDAANEGVCRDVFKRGSKPVDAVFNLAAEVAGVEFNQSHHWQMFTKNLAVLSTPLKIAAEYNVPRFLQTSSVCVYSPELNNPCLEESGLVGEVTSANEGYSLAKRMGEHLAVWAARELDLYTVIVRPSNVWGPRDYFDDRAHVIPALIKKCLDDEMIQANGTGREKREFIYVTDVARGMMAALEHGQPGTAYNLGTSGKTCVAIAKLLEMIKKTCGVTSRPHTFAEMYDAGDNVRWSDSSKAECELSWRYEVSLADGLERTVEWYKENL